MTIHARQRRFTLATAAVLSSALFLTACGGSDSSDDSETSASGSAGYPVSVTSAFGEVTVDAAPERIVALGVEYLDMLASIDELPVAFSAAGETDKEAVNASQPWIADLYTDQYDPSLITAEYKASVEGVAAADPDLVVGPTTLVGQEQYDQISQVAPTFVTVFSAENDWQTDLTDLATLTGKTDAAAAVIDGVDAEFEAAAEELPGLQGKTFNSAFYLPSTGELKIAGSFSWVESLGLTPAENQPAPGEPAVTLSAENLDQFAGDVVMIQVDDEGRAKLEADPRFAQLPAVKNGTVLFVDGPKYYAGVQVGPSSLTWLLPQILPQLKDSALNAAA